MDHLSMLRLIWGRGGRGRGGEGGVGDDNDDNIHSPTSLCELWDLPSNRHIVHTISFFSFLSQNNICNHWSHTTRHSTHFWLLQEAGLRLGGGGPMAAFKADWQCPASEGGLLVCRGLRWPCPQTAGLCKGKWRRWFKVQSVKFGLIED